MVELKVKKTQPHAIIPAYQTEGAACFDLHAMNGGVIPAGLAMTFDTGIAFDVPPGYALLVYSRSGHGFKHSVRLANGVGVVDSDFRGSVQVRLQNDSVQPFIVNARDRIAQAKVIAVPRVSLVEVEELSETARGAGGFGSTG